MDLLIFACDKLSFANLKMQILQFCSADINDSIYQISSVYLISDSSGPIPEIHISHRLLIKLCNPSLGFYFFGKYEMIMCELHVKLFEKGSNFFCETV